MNGRTQVSVSPASLLSIPRPFKICKTLSFGISTPKILITFENESVNFSLTPSFLFPVTLSMIPETI